MELFVSQLGQLAAGAISGFTIGLCYALYSLLLVFMPEINGFLKGFLDVIWGALVFTGLSLAWYIYLGWGIRLGVLLWLALGFCLFRAFLHPLFKETETLAQKREGAKKAGFKAKKARKKPLFIAAKIIWQAANGLSGVLKKGQEAIKKAGKGLWQCLAKGGDEKKP